MVRKELALVGGRLCLDFVNTVSWRGGDEPRDNLGTYADLSRWGEHAGAWSRDEARAARRLAGRHPRKARAVFEAARALRDAVYRTVSAWKRGRAPSAADLACVNAAAPARSELVWRHGQIDWAPATESPRLDSVLWPIVWSAADLVVGGERRRLKSCGSDTCGWLFYDDTRTKRRRWCSMSDCGNRAKARRFYARASARPR